MKQLWLNKQNNSKLIVFFNGWGMDEKVVSNLDIENYDIFQICDYINLDAISEDFSNYAEKILVCWSMGVFVSNCYYDILKNFDKKIAINGTIKPIDDNFGIPENIYDLMIENFNELTVKRFMKKMTLSNIFEDYQSRKDEELKQELISIKNIKPKNTLKFDKVIVSLKDKIIPSKNQLNYWQNSDIALIELEAPHYIFDKYSKWSELL